MKGILEFIGPTSDFPIFLQIAFLMMMRSLPIVFQTPFMGGRLVPPETRMGIARAANTGISGWIDRRGGLHAGAGLFERAVVRVTIPPRHTPLTFYARLGYLFGWLCAAVALGFVLAALWRPRGASGRR